MRSSRGADVRTLIAASPKEGAELTAEFLICKRQQSFKGGINEEVYLSAAALAAALALPGSPALAQTNEIIIGITITTTGPAAALGIPERNALEFVPKEIGGVPLKVIVLDDGGDPTTATTNARRFVTESKADIIMGSSTTPPTIAVSNVANEAGIPHFGLAPFPITPERAKWSVAMPQPIPIMGKVLYEHMKAHNIKTVGYIGYSDSYGDLWFNDFKTQGVPMGMTLVDEERFARPDTSVDRTGAEARRRQSRRDPGRRLRHRGRRCRRPSCASAATRA